MTNLHEAVIELRKKHCEGCREKFTEEEIDNGAKCEFCEHVEETGRKFATLRD